MKCRKYTHRDFESVERWYETRQLRVKYEDFPKVGIIIPGIAVGFLMQTDTKSAILEPFVANPSATPEERDKALTLIMGELLEEAQDLGYKRVFGFSSRPSMLRRALSWGFIHVEESTTVVKELE